MEDAVLIDVCQPIRVLLLVPAPAPRRPSLADGPQEIRVMAADGDFLQMA